MAYPNVEALVTAWLPARLGANVTVTEDPPTRLAADMLVVVVGEIPGPGDTQLTLDVSDIDIDCYAGSRDAARDLAEQVRSQMRLNLPHTTHDDAFVNRVQTLAKPAPTLYDVPVIRRCSATYRITVHATP